MKKLIIKQDQNEDSKTPLVYVKKWMKTRHAIMFRLSNKIVQVNFTDKTEIILSSENKMVIKCKMIIKIGNLCKQEGRKK